MNITLNRNGQKTLKLTKSERAKLRDARTICEALFRNRFHYPDSEEAYKALDSLVTDIDSDVAQADGK